MANGCNIVMAFMIYHPLKCKDYVREIYTFYAKLFLTPFFRQVILRQLWPVFFQIRNQYSHSSFH